jgi:hypothetical protein
MIYGTREPSLRLSQPRGRESYSANILRKHEIRRRTGVFEQHCMVVGHAGNLFVGIAGGTAASHQGVPFRACCICRMPRIAHTLSDSYNMHVNYEKHVRLLPAKRNRRLDKPFAAKCMVVTCMRDVCETFVLMLHDASARAS